VSFISQHQGKDDACGVSDLASAEDQVPVCAEFADDKWDEEFMSELGPADKIMCRGYDSDEVTDDEDEVDPVELPQWPLLGCQVITMW